MLPLVDRPVLQYVVEEAVASGIEQVIFVTGRGKRAIADHFDASPELEEELRRKGADDLLRQVQQISDMVSCCYVRQKEPLGLGHAILCAKLAVGEEPFAVLLADDVIHAAVPVLRQWLHVFEQYQAPVFAVERVPRDDVSRYGIVLAEEVEDRVYRIRDLVEKPPVEEAPSDLAVIGRYILPFCIFDELEKTQPGAIGEIQVTDGLRTLCAARPMYGYEFEGRRYDTGNKLGYLQAVVDFALRREDLGDGFRRYLRSLNLGSRGAGP
jgi:UTP--glucose-1-phosphate uridylyltransferase